MNNHLGGHMNRTWIDRGVLSFLIDSFQVSSMVDVGCGPAGMKEVAQSLDVEWLGIDGDPLVKQDGLLMHDFSKGSISGLGEFDLGWSVEFLEHVYEEYQPNYMDVFSNCKFVVCTAAPPGHLGHHHVNCQPREYWIEVFSRYGLIYDSDVTKRMIEHSTMNKKREQSFMQMTGMFFIRR